MARKTMRELSRLFQAAKVATPGLVATLKLATVGTDKGLRFQGVIGIDGVDYEVAGDNGKLRTFSDVDSFLKFAAKSAEVGDGVYQVEVDTGALLASTVPSDLISWSEAQIVRLNKVKAAQNGVVAKIDEQLTLMVGWENGNAAQQAKKAETEAQRACVVTDIAAIDTEIARLTAVVNG